jgi:hypothetical protein
MIRLLHPDSKRFAETGRAHCWGWVAHQGQPTRQLLNEHGLPRVALVAYLAVYD